MFFYMVSERVGIGEALLTLRTAEAADPVVKGLEMSAQGEAGAIYFLAIGIAAAVLLHQFD